MKFRIKEVDMLRLNNQRLPPLTIVLPPFPLFRT